MQHTHFWIIRHKQQILIDPHNALGPNFMQHADYLDGDHSEPIMVGYWQGLPCYATDTRSPPEGFEAALVPLRQVFGVAGAEAFAMAGRASQLIDWQLNHQHCGRCGHQTQLHEKDFAMQCDQCGLSAYPRISPAVMVLVRRGRELLLARSPHFKPGMFSALAGFVEAGETLEQCAAREVKEEVGVEIEHLRYFSSQSWPFPNSLMIAFFADHCGGDITPDPSEIEAADWFDMDTLPTLPDPVSIARRLIEAALAEMRPR
jgi:NAD+ diphosphatase